MIINPALFVPALSAGGSMWGKSSPGFRESSPPDKLAASVGLPTVIAKGVDITQLFNGSANQSFPPRTWLGFGLDMTTITPSDITSVASNVLTLSRVIMLQDGGDPQTFGGVSWIVPKGVDATADLAGPEQETRSFKSGDEAYQAMSGDTDVNARYYAVSGGVSAAYAVKKSLQRNYQYLMMAHNNNGVNVRFVEFDKAINEPMLRRRLDRIPKFDANNQDTVEQYRILFSTIGSHIITGLNYGDRFQLQVWADNSNETVNQNFDADVAVEFNGLTSGGSVDAGIEGSSEFNAFEGTVQKTVTCKGGDEKLAADLQSNIYDPNVFKTYSSWAKTTGENPRLHSFQTMPLWQLISAANDSKVSGRVRDVESAFNWIVENPKQHITKATLTVSSDWGTIDLLTPSAFFANDPSRPDTMGAFFSKNKIEWGSSGAGVQLVEVSFIIVNDGSPVDIALSHGSAGSLYNTGKVTAEFDGKAYTNDQVHDNNWNTQNFWACTVDPHGRMSRNSFPWASENTPSTATS